MQTPPLLPSLNAAPPAAAAARAPEGIGADQQFTQMLSRQMADREAAKTATKAIDGPKPVPVKSDSSAKSNASSDADNKVADTDPARSGPADAGKATDPAKPADGSASTAAAPKDPADSDGKTVVTSATDAALSASAAVMALVANANQVAAKSTPAAIATTAATGQEAADAGRLLASARPANGKLDLKATPDTGPVESAAKDVAAKSAAPFGSALQLAAQSRAEVETVATPIPAALLAVASDAANVLPQLSPSAFAAIAPAGPHPGNGLAPYVGASGWDQSLGQRMVWMVAGAEQSASLTLNPPDLGPMQVVLHVTNGQADASFFSAQPEVRQALEAAMPKLREMLGEAGVTLGQTSVSAGSPQQQGQSGQTASGSRQRPAGATETAAPLVGGSRTIGGNGLVDTFA